MAASTSTSTPQTTLPANPPSNPDEVIISVDQFSGTSTEVCDICMDAFSTGQDVSSSSCCQLQTHAACLAAWLRASSRPVSVYHGLYQPQTTCPKCRREMRSAPLEDAFDARREALDSRAGRDSVDVTVRRLMFQEQVDYYFEQSAMHFRISGHLWWWGNSCWGKSSRWTWLWGIERKKEETRRFRWLSWQHKQLANAYRDYARDWVALSERGPL
jgi:hypothetical protein